MPPDALHHPAPSTAKDSPLDALLRQLAEAADDGRVRTWAARLLGGEAVEGGNPTTPSNPEGRRSEKCLS